MKRHRKAFHEKGHAHELTFSCYRRFPFFKSDRTCQWLAESIEQARLHLNFPLWADVMMPDHIHLLISSTADDAEIGKILRAIKAPPAKRAIQFLEGHSPHWLEKITRRRGHANPVRKQFAERPRDWHWSSAAWDDDQSDIPIPVDPISFDWLE